jgi:hypothetical protein
VISGWLERQHQALQLSKSRKEQLEGLLFIVGFSLLVGVYFLPLFTIEFGSFEAGLLYFLGYSFILILAFVLTFIIVVDLYFLLTDATDDSNSVIVSQFFAVIQKAQNATEGHGEKKRPNE